MKPLKIEVMTRTRIELTAVWGNEDAQSSVLVSRRRWTAIQRGAVHTVDAASSYEGKLVQGSLAIRQRAGIY